MHRAICSVALFVLLTALAAAQSFPTTVSGALSIKKVDNFEIKNLRIFNSRDACVRLLHCNTVIIRDCIFSGSPDEAVHIEDCANIQVINCYISDMGGGIYVRNSTAVSIRQNQFENVLWRSATSRGQFVQFHGVYGNGNEVIDNIGENTFPNTSAIDLVNVYKSSGTAESPILIRGNRFRGGGPWYSSGGIIVGDYGGAYVTATGNILVNPGQYGMAIAGGTHMVIDSNEIYGARQSFSNVGIYVMPDSRDACGMNRVSRNRVDWTAASGEPNPYYNSSECGDVEGESTNDFDAKLKPASLLPANLLAPDLVGDFRLDGSNTDATGVCQNAVNYHIRYQPGPTGQTAYFDGVDAYFTIASSPWYRPRSHKISVSMWVLPETLEGAHGLIRSNDADGSNDGWSAVIRDGNFCPSITTTAARGELTCKGLQVGEWNYVAFTYDGEQLRGYVNGKPAGEMTLSGDLTFRHVEPLLVGSVDGNGYFQGNMGELKIYRGIVSADSVAAHYRDELKSFDVRRSTLAANLTSTILEEAPEWSVYPNPATDFLHYGINAPLSGPNTLTVRLLTFSQQTVYMRQFGGNGYLTGSLPMWSLPRGVYLLECTLNSKRTVREILR